MGLIYLLRHCTTKWVEEDRIQGKNDIPLSGRGINEAEHLSLKFKNISFQKIFSSDSSRATQTASIIAQYHACPFIKTSALREISFGKLEGMTRDEIKNYYPHVWDRWMSNPEKLTFPEGDFVKDFISASWKTFIDISGSSKNNILIVSHGVFIRSIVANILLPENIRTMNSTVEVRSGEFVRIKANRNSYTIIKSD